MTRILRHFRYYREDDLRCGKMASDPLQVGGVKWPNMMQKPTGIVAGAANPAMNPTALNNAQMPAESSKIKFQPTSVDVTPSTDATKGRSIDTYA